MALAPVIALLATLPGWAALSPVLVSPPGGHYSNTISVVVSNPNPSSLVRYTLNGAEPTFGSLPLPGTPFTVTNRSNSSNVISLYPGTATVNQHTDGWFPPKGTIPKATVLRSRVFGSGTNVSSTETHTYFIGTNPMQKYQLPVVSLAVNTNDFYNYVTGIYVLGKVFDDYVKAHPGEPLTGHTPANYTQRGSNWEKPGFMEWFEPDGRRAYTRNVLIDIQGQSSRSFRQKSLGLKTIADESGVDTFRYPFFPGLTNRQGDTLTRFDHLRLANSGNDWAYSMYRDALCHVMAGPTRIDTLAYRPVVVYLDGEFWGVHNLREQEDPDFIMDHYDVPQDQVIICQPPGYLLEGVPGDEQSYTNLISFLETHDMNQGTNYAYVATQMDVDNFIAYQVAEIYFANADWPHNNIRVWRKRTAAYTPSAPYGHDGRWRWLLFDVDLGYGHPWSGGFGENSLSYALDPNGRPGVNAPWSTLMFRRLMTRPEFRNQFINTYADALNSLYKESRATALVTQLQAVIEPAMADHIQRWRTQSDSTNGWKAETKVLSLFASQRPIYARQHIVTQFGLAGFATVTLDMEPRGAGEFQLNNLRINESTPGVVSTNPYPWRGTYFRGVPVQVEARPRPGYRFLGWVGRADLGSNSLVTLNLTAATNLTARFERAIAPHGLAAAPFVFDSWARALPAGQFPAHMLLEQSSQKDPGLSTPMDGEWKLPYALASRSRIQGLDAAGLGFINTSDPQNTNGAGYVGSAVVALNTVGCSNILVSWIGGTLATNEQPYGLRLQYAVGEQSFVDVLDGRGNPVEYLRSATVNHEAILGPTRLPAAVQNQPYVRLRWKYYRSEESKGPRALLRLDDILVTLENPVARAHIDTLTLASPRELRLTFSGPPRREYPLEASINLKTWTPLSRFVTGLDGVGSALLPGIPTSGSHFYRFQAPTSP